MSAPHTPAVTVLTSWHKKQAAMLYHYTDPDYLKALHRMISDLINGVVDPLLDMAKAQNRDEVLSSRVWGDRNTSRNWENNAWPILKDLQASLAKDIAMRTAGCFQRTAVTECMRGISEYSVDWTSPDEEEALKLALKHIEQSAARLDRTVDPYENGWNDYRLAYHYPAFADLHQQIPQMHVNCDVSVDTGQVAPRTGVYMSVDDPHASLQFAWTEHGGCKLRQANTFNEVGLAALSAVGREALWFDAARMYAFAMSKPYEARFRNSVFLFGEPCPELAPAAVARAAFISRPCRWVLIEAIPRQFEELSALVEVDEKPVRIARRIVGGEQCVDPGFYFTPSAPNSRRFFATGETAPRLDSSYGSTFWQWDMNQGQ